MSGVAAEKERRIVPRWRDVKTSALTGELGSLVVPTRADPAYHEFAAKLHEWERDPTPVTASELVPAAVLFNRHAEALPAAEFIVEHAAVFSPSAVSLAERLIGSRTPIDPNTSIVDDGPVAVRERIRQLRSWLRNDPRQALTWADLAREYASVGLHGQAKTAMHIGLRLAPSHRYLLRCAARLYTHLDQPERARALLLAQPRTRQDPWLMSAEIAVATVAGKSSTLVRSGRQILQDGDLAPRHLSELAGALGTLDLISGKDRDARRLFRQSLARPTDNAVAQAGWASRHLTGLEVREEHLSTPRSFEARAWRHYWHEDWRRALLECNEWLLDEPYSSRPAIFGSFLASVPLRDFEAAVRIADAGLRANPGDTLLLNNLAFALASANETEKAGEAFRKIRLDSVRSDLRATISATEGLLCFRQGDAASGRALYEQAITAAANAAPHVRVLACIFLAREEYYAGQAEANAAIARARDECRRQPDQWLEQLLDDMLTDSRGLRGR